MILVLLTAVLSMAAIPAMRRWRTVTMSDGTQQKVMLVGDEHHHYYVNANGKRVMEENQIFRLATVADTVRTAKAAVQAFQVKHATTMKRLAATKAARRASASSSSYTGSKKGLIILVQFSDKKFSMTNPKATYNAIANETGYESSMGTTGSVHDYFNDQSYGKFNLTFDVVGPITLSHSYTYYGKNYTAYYGGQEYDLSDLHAGRMIREACLAAEDSVDFTQYDWNGDGEADQVYVLYAGQGEASGGSSSTVWPHEYNLSSMAFMETIDSIYTAQNSGSGFGRGRDTVDENAIYNYFLNYFNISCDGIAIDTYACSNEAYVEGYNTYLMGIGTICHEFSHCLGFPDTYDTQNGLNYGMGYWDLMSSGSYNGPYGLGWKPAGYTAWERNEAGWLSYSTLSDGDSITAMPALTDEATAYKIVNPAHTDEYYLLENRQQQGWDEYVPGSGLLVTHIDYDKSIWDNNIVNSVTTVDTVTNDHQRMTIVPADNTLKLRSYTNEVIESETTDVYPYMNGTTIINDSISDYSSPSDTLYNANSDGTNLLHFLIRSIRCNDDGTVSFAYNPQPTTVISAITVDGATPVAIYDLEGRRRGTSFASLSPGIYIVVMSNGEKKKVVVK